MNTELLNNKEVKEIAQAFAAFKITTSQQSWDDFVKSQELGKEWEIVELDRCFHLNCTNTPALYFKAAVERGAIIKSVRGNSDMEVFTVNETVAFTSDFKIRSFRTSEGRMYVDCVGETGNLYNVPFGALRKIKREHTFITDDNVKIYAGDEYFFCGEPLIVYSSKAVWYDIDGALARTGNKHFSTRVKAEEYCQLNRANISIQNMVDWGILVDGSRQTERLIEIVKQK